MKVGTPLCNANCYSATLSKWQTQTFVILNWTLLKAQEYKNILRDLGLSGNESEVYELLLKSGTMTANQVSKKTGISPAPTLTMC
ncbi:MAG: hypothetical protein KDD62_12920, partial [Bdellovibrionales bacterium]|nr:hypothetical protein [Bdellovibrionales bacterium]